MIPAANAARARRAYAAVAAAYAALPVPVYGPPLPPRLRAPYYARLAAARAALRAARGY